MNEGNEEKNGGESSRDSRQLDTTGEKPAKQGSSQN